MDTFLHSIACLWLATFAACIEFTRHPSDEAVVPYPDQLLERVGGDCGDIENIPVTRRVGDSAVPAKWFCQVAIAGL